MFKLLTPILALIVAVLLFFTYVQPTYDEIKKTQAERDEYINAIEKAEELLDVIARLVREQNSIPPADLERLQALLPDEINEVRLLLDLDTLAIANKMKFENISIKVPESEQQEMQFANEYNQNLESGTGFDEGYAQAPRSPYKKLLIGFDVVGEYKDFRNFLADAERSLILMEVTSIKVSKKESSDGKKAPPVFSVEVEVYSLSEKTKV